MHYYRTPPRNLTFPGHEILIKRSFSTESTGQGRRWHVLLRARGARGTNLVESIYTYIYIVLLYPAIALSLAFHM